VAALMDHPTAFEAPVVAVLSGGNIDPLLMMRVIRHGLAANGRFLSLRLRISDRPGALAKLLTELGEADANVMDVEHVRTRPSLALGEVEVALQLETRGLSHAEALISRLRAAGYQPEPASY
jgi:threonine dehydratase